jgi:hypothetical protein
VAGDDTLVSDDRVAQQAWGDMRRGIGVFEYLESESLSGCADSDLDIAQGIITLPTKRVLIGTGAAIPGAWAAQAPVYGLRILDNGDIRWLVWTPLSATFYIHIFTTDFWIARNPSGGLIHTIVPYAGYYALATGTGFYKLEFVGAAPFFTPGWAMHTEGLCEHDGKLYTYNPTDGKLYWALGAAEAYGAVAWAGSSTFPVPLEPGEVVRQLLEWKDAFDNPCVTIITDRRVMLYSDQDYFGTLFRTGKQGGRPYGHVWTRDGNLYLTNYPFNDTIWALDHQSIDEVSPNKGGGIASNQTFAVSHLAGNFRNLFAFCPTRQGKSNPGRILKATEAFGWSPLARGKLVNPEDWSSALVSPITGGVYGQEEVLSVYADGTTYVQQSPDRGDLAYNVDDLTYEPGPLWLVSAWTDCSLEDVAKLAAWFRVLAIKNDRTYGLPTGGALYFSYEVDGLGWAALGSRGPTFPNVMALPSSADQTGKPFIRLRWAIGLSSTVLTPIVKAVVLAYERAPDIYDGLQVPIDLSAERFSSQTDQRFYLLTRDDLLVELDKLKQAPGKPKRFYKVTIGVGTSQKVYNACDVRVSGNLDPSTGYGNVVFTLRDVTAPPDGLPSVS